jgi:predicted ferric reductase
VVLMKFSFWGEPIGPVMAVLMALGSAAALASLFGRVGLDRRAVGVIEGIERHPDIRVIKIAIRLTSRWAGHEAGQFAFVRFGGVEGPHRFTISSAWSGDGRMFFLVKDLATTPARLRPH